MAMGDDDVPPPPPPVDLEYHLGSSDHSGIIITPIKLRGANYDEWSKAMRRALIAKRKFGFVDGSIKEPTADSSQRKHWIAVNSMLVSWISNTLDDSVRSTIGDYDYVRELWQLGDIRDEDYLHYFLIGLDDPYKEIRSQLLVQHPLPHVDNAYQVVINTERLQTKDGKVKENVMAFKVDSRVKSTDSESPFCTHCNREGHDKEGCYQLIGFPEWWDENRKGGRGQGRGARGGRSGGRGASGGRNNTSTSTTHRANAVHGGVNNNSAASNNQSSSTQGLASVTSDQAQQIIELRSNKSKSRLEGKNKVLWIVDTGASNHVTNDLSIMRNVKTIQNCPVGLPDGQTVNANQLGSVTLDGGLVIDNVLFDQSTRMVIGVGERENGLNFFRGVPQVKVLAVDCVVDLWHQRMGHPSEKVLKLLPPSDEPLRLRLGEEMIGVGNEDDFDEFEQWSMGDLRGVDIEGMEAEGDGAPSGGPSAASRE
ncbi:uncharacterized protein LOC110691605 [Chenopodium quinoa]|uniref:uncharacterized protein LOC110691605 n=1 Tax=Chenopodium quinoa TaxID=63459 RepID=UPI000B77A995|nr:uncharacterized protein LOC110691605 [Chenopodium quinoa]